MFTNALNEKFGSLLKKVSPASRRQYARDVAITLRAHRSDEILANKDAAGKAMVQRKPQKAHRRQKNKSGKMFKKLGRRSNMRVHANANFASVAFQPKNKKIADNHHYGNRVQVNKYSRVKYPERTLMGMGKKEEQIIFDKLYDLMAEAL